MERLQLLMRSVCDQIKRRGHKHLRSGGPAVLSCFLDPEASGACGLVGGYQALEAYLPGQHPLQTASRLEVHAKTFVAKFLASRCKMSRLGRVQTWQTSYECIPEHEKSWKTRHIL